MSTCKGLQAGHKWSQVPQAFTPLCHGTTTSDGRQQEGVPGSLPVSFAIHCPLESKEPHFHPPPAHTAHEVPGCHGCSPKPLRPVGREHHGAACFDDIQDKVPEEAPCLGIHPRCWLILWDRWHAQTRQLLGEPRHSLPSHRMGTALLLCPLELLW